VENVQREAELLLAGRRGELAWWNDACSPWRLRLDGDGPLEVYYGPFDYVNFTARLAIVGITPSKAETVVACAQVAEARRRGLSAEEALCLVKQNASFVGLRGSLVAMLDGLGLPRYLGLESTAALFTAEGAALLHATSAVRYPVLWRGENYTGHSPPLLRVPALVSYVETLLGPELQAVPDALVVPLGKCVAEALRHLVERGRLDPGRCLSGFPHPSGANGRRVEQYRRLRPALRQVVAAWFEGRR
jgi:hypothetical protein